YRYFVSKLRIPAPPAAVAWPRLWRRSDGNVPVAHADPVLDIVRDNCRRGLRCNFSGRPRPNGPRVDSDSTTSRQLKPYRARIHRTTPLRPPASSNQLQPRSRIRLSTKIARVGLDGVSGQLI